MTKEEAKIKRLDKKIDELKNEIQELKSQNRNLERNLQWERSWRVDFQRLMKEVVQIDSISPEYTL